MTEKAISDKAKLDIIVILELFKEMPSYLSFGQALGELLRQIISKENKRLSNDKKLVDHLHLGPTLNSEITEEGKIDTFFTQIRTKKQEVRTDLSFRSDFGSFFLLTLYWKNKGFQVEGGASTSTQN